MNTSEACPRIESLSALIDNELRDPERLTLEAHLADCAVCARVLAGLQQLRTHVAALPDMTPDFDVTPDVDRRIGAGAAHPESQCAPQPPRTRWWQPVVLAPVGAISVWIGLWIGAALAPATPGAARQPSAQMAPFSALPPGALCPALSTCGGTTP